MAVYATPSGYISSKNRLRYKLVSDTKTAYDNHMATLRRGFTIIEIVIVLALMGILFTFAIAQLSSTQMSARDNALRAYAETIARGLEEYYRTGNTAYSISPGKYPSTNEFRHASGENIADVGTQYSGGYLDTWLSGARLEATSKLRLITTSGQTPENATNISTSTPTGVVTYEPLIFTPGSGGDPDQFSFCTTKAAMCNRFNLYYRTEKDNAIHTIRSEHQ